MSNSRAPQVLSGCILILSVILVISVRFLETRFWERARNCCIEPVSNSPAPQVLSGCILILSVLLVMISVRFLETRFLERARKCCIEPVSNFPAPQLLSGCILILSVLLVMISVRFLETRFLYRDEIFRDGPRIHRLSFSLYLRSFRRCVRCVWADFRFE